MPSSSARGIGRRGLETIFRRVAFQHAKASSGRRLKGPGGTASARPAAPGPGAHGPRSCPGSPVPVVPAWVAIPSHCRRLDSEVTAAPAAKPRAGPAGSQRGRRFPLELPRVREPSRCCDQQCEAALLQKTSRIRDPSAIRETRDSGPPVKGIARSSAAFPTTCFASLAPALPSEST
jgi:hypothetical protein